jgi:chromosome partitioning protein
LAKRISIINFKGGVGKTTLAFHLGTGLAVSHESRVLLIDMDHQSSLSILCLGGGGWENTVRGGRCVDAIFRPFIGDDRSLPGNEIVIRSPMHSRYPDYDRMDLVPASLQLDDVEIELTASHQGNAIRSEWNKRTLVCRWIEEGGIDDKYDYIIFDCPPATKIVSQNAVAASHGYIIPVIPEAVMERGAPHLRDMIRTGIDNKLKVLSNAMGEERTVYVPDTALAGLVITRIQAARGGYTIDHSQHLDSLQRLWGSQLLKPYISQGTGVSSALSEGVPVYDRWKTQNVGGRGLHEQYFELTDEIKNRIDAL